MGNTKDSTGQVAETKAPERLSGPGHGGTYTCRSEGFERTNVFQGPGGM